MCDILIFGCEEEDDNSLRVCYFICVCWEVVSVNKLYYKQWVEEVDGVGRVKIFLLWNGDGMVKVVIINVNLELVLDILIKKVKDYIDLDEGQGEGQVLIGVVVMVESVVWKEIEIFVFVLFELNSLIDDVKVEIEKGVLNLFKKIVFEENIVCLL